jgi:hypothetical protein
MILVILRTSVRLVGAAAVEEECCHGRQANYDAVMFSVLSISHGTVLTYLNEVIKLPPVCTELMHILLSIFEGGAVFAGVMARVDDGMGANKMWILRVGEECPC